MVQSSRDATNRDFTKIWYTTNEAAGPVRIPSLFNVKKMRSNESRFNEKCNLTNNYVSPLSLLTV